MVPLIAARPHRATGSSARQLGMISLSFERSPSWLHVNATLHVDVVRPSHSRGSEARGKPPDFLGYSCGFCLVRKVSNQSTVHRDLTP